MLAYVFRRLLLMIPTLIGMTFILFAVVRFAPGLAGAGDVGSRAGGTEGSMQNTAIKQQLEQARLRRLHMIDENGKPIVLPLQYTYWLWDTLRGNFGDSVQYHVPVIDLIRERLPTTLAMNVLTTLIVYIIAIPGGMLSAVKHGKGFDVSWGIGTLTLYSLPQIWIGGLLIGYLANPQNLAWFPAGSLHEVNTDNFTFFQYFRDCCIHLVLPLVLYSYAGFATLSKFMRASILDNLGQDYARTARAKGLPAYVVLTRHVFRNSLIPMVTIFGGLLPGLIGGSVIVEEIFSIKGMGELTVTAATARDLPVIQATAFIASVLSLISLLLADIGYVIVDPRVSYE